MKWLHAGDAMSNSNYKTVWIKFKVINDSDESSFNFYQRPTDFSVIKAEYFSDNNHFSNIN